VAFGSYETGDFYDETLLAAGARSHTALLVQRLATMTHRELRERQAAAERALLPRGITFNGKLLRSPYVGAFTRPLALRYHLTR